MDRGTVQEFGKWIGAAIRDLGLAEELIRDAHQYATPEYMAEEIKRQRKINSAKGGKISAMAKAAGR